MHCHSLFSDGALSPEELIAKAVNNCINLLALTDHDTINGLKALHDAALNTDIKIINGIEISARWKKHDIHILGLNINLDSEKLHDLLFKQSNSRKTRANNISDLLDGIGLKNGYSKACAVAGHEHVTRPHFAQVLINEGFAKDINDAFKNYLSRGKKAFAPTEWVALTDAVDAIIQSGGSAVIAHPLKYKLTGTKLNALINEFKECGGIGLEVVSGGMNNSQIGKLTRLCEIHELFASTGSDFHSEEYSYIKLGRQQRLPSLVKPIWTLWNLDK